MLIRLKLFYVAILIFTSVIFLGRQDFFPDALAQTEASSDAIAIRVMSNPEHYSPIRWYYENVNVQGALQSLSADGYEAVRDGRSVYVNAANIYDGDGDGVFEKYYTNIYIISYNQNSEQATVDIFGQLLAHWKFNVNLMPRADTVGECENSRGETKVCSGKDSCPAGYLCQSGRCAIRCLTDGECPGGDYCSGSKAKLIRDTIRLADLADLKSNLEKYRDSRGFYPKLESGSYLKGRTISVWPSWQDNLAKELGEKSLRVDPINKLGPCAFAGFNAETCWNDQEKKFISADFSLPAGSRAYNYQTEDGGDYKLCVELESKSGGFISDSAFKTCVLGRED